MKKNKNVTVILFLVVGLLWGVVLYKLYKSFFSEEERFVMNNAPGKLQGEIALNENEEFSLLLNYQDPFLGRHASMNLNAGKPSIKKNIPAKPKEPEKVIDWSFLSYMGLIKNQHSNKLVGLVRIRDREYMISEGDKIEEVSFIKNYKDSIKVSYQGVTKYIRK